MLVYSTESQQSVNCAQEKLKGFNSRSKKEKEQQRVFPLPRYTSKYRGYCRPQSRMKNRTNKTMTSWRTRVNCISRMMQKTQIPKGDIPEKIFEQKLIVFLNKNVSKRRQILMMSFLCTNLKSITIYIPRVLTGVSDLSCLCKPLGANPGKVSTR